MNSLLTCDYQELLGQQPVSRSAMASLQQGALNEEPVSQEYFRKHLISLGAYLALQRIEQDHLDPNTVLAHIDADQLEELGFRRSFSEWGNERIHIEIVSGYIQQVINDLYIKTQDGIYIEKKMYQRTADAWARWRAEHQDEDPSAEELSAATGVPNGIVDAVGRNERWKKEQEALREQDARRLQRLKEIIRDREDLSFWVKLDFLETLVRMRDGKRDFFYALYGVDDGIEKSPEQIAGSFKMTPEEAMQYYLEMLGRRHPHSITCVSKDDYYDLMIELREFLIENEENRKVFEAWCEREQEKSRQRQKKRWDYLD